MRLKFRMNDSRQFHPHEDSAHEEGDEDADEASGEKNDPVESGHGGFVGLIEDDETESTEGKQEARCKSLHDVLAIDSVLHEGHLFWGFYEKFENSDFCKSKPSDQCN